LNRDEQRPHPQPDPRPPPAHLRQSFRHHYSVLGGGYYLAGRAASEVKRRLREAGIAEEIVRRAAVATYEAEMNICIHAISGEVVLTGEGNCVSVVANDRGPGIADIERALRPGFSTAPPKARSLGFGAGMGFANMQRCADEFSITTHLGQGTRVEMVFMPRE